MKNYKIQFFTTLIFFLFSAIAGCAEDNHSDDKYIDRVMENKIKSPDQSGCIDGEIKIQGAPSEPKMVSHYCFDSILKSLTSTQKCFDKSSLQIECLNNSAGPFKLVLKDLKKESGPLAFSVCKKLNGTPQNIEYWNTKKWIKTERCLYSDGSYLDLNSLILKAEYR